MPHLAKVIAVMLDNACCNPWYPPWYPEKTDLEEPTSEDSYQTGYKGGHLGWSTYRFDLCCVSYEVIARKRNDKWQVKKYRTLGMDE